MIADTLTSSRVLTSPLVQTMPCEKLITGLLTCLNLEAARLLLEDER